MPRAKGIKIRVKGKDLRKAAGPDLDREMSRVRHEYAQEAAQRARGKSQSLGSVHAHVSAGYQSVNDSIRMRTGQNPAILGAEFGGGRRRTTRQFPPWRGNKRSTGYALYPSLRSAAMKRSLTEKVNEAIDRAGGNKS